MKKISDYKSLDNSMSDLCKFENKNVELTNEMESRIQALRAKYTDRLEALSTKSSEMRANIATPLHEESVEKKVCLEKKGGRIPLQATDYERIECIIRRIEENRRDVTTPYRKWFRIGLALASIFGEEGQSLYHRISRFYDGYTPQETERQYNYCMRYTNHTTNIGTLIYLLNE